MPLALGVCEVVALVVVQRETKLALVPVSGCGWCVKRQAIAGFVATPGTRGALGRRHPAQPQHATIRVSTIRWDHGAIGGGAAPCCNKLRVISQRGGGVAKVAVAYEPR